MYAPRILWTKFPRPQEKRSRYPVKARATSGWSKPSRRHPQKKPGGSGLIPGAAPQLIELAALSDRFELAVRKFPALL